MSAIPSFSIFGASCASERLFDFKIAANSLGRKIAHLDFGGNNGRRDVAFCVDDGHCGVKHNFFAAHRGELLKRLFEASGFAKRFAVKFEYLIAADHDAVGVLSGNRLCFKN